MIIPKFFENTTQMGIYTHIMYMFYIYLALHDRSSDPQHTQKLGKILFLAKEQHIQMTHGVH